MVGDLHAGDAVLGLIQDLDGVRAAGTAVPAPDSGVDGAWWGAGGKRGCQGGALVLAGPPETTSLPDTMMVASSLNWTQFTFCETSRESAPCREP